MNNISDGAASLKALFDQTAQVEVKPEELLKSVLEKAALLMKAEAACVRLYDSKSEELLLAGSYRAHGKHNFNFKAAAGTADTLEGEVFLQQKACFHREKADNDSVSETGGNGLFYTGFPVTCRGLKLGVFSMYFAERREFSRQDKDYLSMIVNFLASSEANRLLELEVGRSRLNMAKVLIKVMEEKDLYTMGHSERVRNYAVKIGERLNMSDEEFSILSEFSILHDIGKITIDSNILNNPGKLTREQWGMVQQHPLIGERILSAIDGFTSSIPLIKHHHERLDGGGYPEGLKGEEIPLLAKIIAVCDSFDAMVSKRAYRDALALEKAKDELLRNTGSQFDAEVVDLMVGLIDSGGVDFSEGQGKSPEESAGLMRYAAIQDNGAHSTVNVPQNL